MDLNYTLIALAVIIQFILGALWYSPLMFGKWWMEIMEATHLSKEELKKMQKEMAPFYLLQLVITVIFTIALAIVANYAETLSISIYCVAFLILVGFVVPTQVSGVVWGNTKRKFWIKQLFIMKSYQFVAIFLAAYILSYGMTPSSLEGNMNGKLNITVVCENALTYMTFPDAESANTFVEDCKQGKYPEVIEQYKKNMGLGDGATI